MKANRFAWVLVAALSTAAVPALADDAAKQEAKQVVNLKDGSTLYVFKNGKIARQDKMGRAVNVKIGDVLETADGQKVKVMSNEVARLDSLIRRGHEGN